MILIDPPSPFANVSEWTEFLIQMESIGSKDPEVLEAIASAKQHLTNHPLTPKSSSVERAMQLLNTSPLPDDAEAQMQILEDQANADEKILFAWLWEGMFVQREK